MNNDDIAQKAERLGLISWRQVGRVRKGQAVWQAGGRQVTPEELLEIIKQIEGEQS